MDIIKFRLSKEELSKLAIEFKKIDNIQDKFKFWLEKLNSPYYLWSYYLLSDVQDFIIREKNNEEAEIINKYCLNQYLERQGILNRRNLQSLEKLKEDFIEKFQYTENKLRLIESEKEKIKKVIRENELEDFMGYNRWFMHGYNNYYLNNKEPDLTTGIHETENLVQQNHGYIYAQYHNFIDNFDLLNPPKEIEVETTINQQLLILYYLGYIKSLENLSRKGYKNPKFPDKNGKDILLSFLLNRRSKEDIRIKIGKDCKYIKTEIDLKFVQSLFKRLKLENIVELINKDIEVILKKNKKLSN